MSMDGSVVRVVKKFKTINDVEATVVVYLPGFRSDVIDVIPSSCVRSFEPFSRRRRQAWQSDLRSEQSSNMDNMFRVVVCNSRLDLTKLRDWFWKGYCSIQECLEEVYDMKNDSRG